MILRDTGNGRATVHPESLTPWAERREGTRCLHVTSPAAPPRIGCAVSVAGAAAQGDPGRRGGTEFSSIDSTGAALPPAWGVVSRD